MPSAGIVRSRRFAVFPLAVLVAGAALCASGPAPLGPGEPVVLVHGLGHDATLMKPLADALQAEGFRTCSIDYPSLKYRIDTLAALFVLPAVRRCFPKDTIPIHFVTHSMGGLVVRRLEKLNATQHLFKFGRVVMIAPPNKGSQVVDRLGLWEPFSPWGGAAARELGTRGEKTIVLRLGTPAFTFGIIAGTLSVEPFFSRMLPGPDDGKVSVENTKLAGMSDFVEIHASHTRILRRPETMQQTVAFLKTGRFLHPPEKTQSELESPDSAGMVPALLVVPGQNERAQ